MSRPINFTDTSVTKKPYVEIDGIEYEVQDGTYEGGTDLNANTFNKMQDELNMFRNLINCKYGTGLISTHNGISYTKNSDGSFTLNGTATGGTSNIIITDIMSLNGTYTISLVGNSNSSIYMRGLDIDNSYSIDLSTETNALTTNTINSRYVFYIYVKDGTVLNNVKIYPQLEEGTTATSFTPWAGYIVESGSNDNGSYIKYSDGTMICRTTLSKEKFLTSTSFSATAQGINIYRSNNAIWKFPVSFVDTDIQINITTNTLLNGTRFALGRVNGEFTKLSVEIQLLGLEDFTESALGYTNLKNVFVIAIGKWK